MAIVTTAFTYDSELRMDVLDWMTDVYGGIASGSASDGPFRRFTVSTTESLKEP